MTPQELSEEIRVDRECLLALAKNIAVLDRTVRRDECGEYRINGRKGHLYHSRGNIYLCLIDQPMGGWIRAKQVLDFCAVSQDGDGEGVLVSPARTFTAEEAAKIRKTLGFPKRPAASASQLANLRPFPRKTAN
jgi:hypothetical protein